MFGAGSAVASALAAPEAGEAGGEHLHRPHHQALAGEPQADEDQRAGGEEGGGGAPGGGVHRLHHPGGVEADSEANIAPGQAAEAVDAPDAVRPDGGGGAFRAAEHGGDQRRRAQILAGEP